MCSEISTIPPKLKGSHCLNCETALSDETYCPVCGQENTNRNISIWMLAQDFLRDYFSFDSKFFTTLIPLFTRPGNVPKEFMEGHRVKYIPPFRIVIFSSFILFTVWGLTFTPDADDSKSMSSIINKNLIEDDSELAQAQLDSITEAEGIDLNITMEGDTAYGLQDKIKSLTAALDAGRDLQSSVDSIALDNTPFEKKMYLQGGKMYQADRGALIKYFISNLSLMILIIQPFFALLLKLLYIRRRKEFKFIGHLVFSFYFHAFILILLTIGIVVKLIWTEMPLERFILLPSIVYLAFAIKKYYAQSWGKSLLKVFLIFLFYTVMVSLFMAMSMMMSFYFF